MISLTTHATRSWLPRMRPYLASLQARWPGEMNLLTVNCDAPAEFMEQYSLVSAVRVPVVAGAPEYSNSLQHGAFIDYVPGEDNDVLIYTDGDIVLQRTPTRAEFNLFATLPADTVACSWNSAPDETLAVEATRLFPRGDVAAAFGDMVNTAPCFNIGVIGARRATWERIHSEYMDHYERALALFAAPQRQQWLVSWVIATLGLKVHVLSHVIHMHGCYPLPVGASVNGTAQYYGETVLFRHHL